MPVVKDATSPSLRLPRLALLCMVDACISKWSTDLEDLYKGEPGIHTVYQDQALGFPDLSPAGAKTPCFHGKVGK